MRLYYIGESEGPRYYVRSALGVDAERWNDLFLDIHEWRIELRERYSIPMERDLNACDLLTGRELLARNGKVNERLTPQQGAEVFLNGLHCIEDSASSIGGIEVINVCLHKPDGKRYEQVSLDRLLNRINSSVRSAGRHAFLIFDEGRERMITRAYRRLKVYNPVPSRYELWEEGERTRNVPVENIIGGPAFRNSGSDCLLQMTGFIAHALLEQEKELVSKGHDTGIREAFSILDKALNRKASSRDPQGVVRR